MTAAIFAAREGAQVVLLEHKDRVGKKILSTGNGRCNLSNRLQEPFCYRSGQPDFPWKALGAFTLPMTLEYFDAGTGRISVSIFRAGKRCFRCTPSGTCAGVGSGGDGM